jgi:hypothetical protein
MRNRDSNLEGQTQVGGATHKPIVCTLGQHFDHLGTAPFSLRTDREAFLAILIDQVQYPHRPSIVRLRARRSRSSIHGCDAVPQPNARTVVQP